MARSSNDTAWGPISLRILRGQRARGIEDRLHQIMRASFHLLEDAPQVVTDDAEAEKLDTAEEQDRDQERHEAAGRLWLHDEQNQIEDDRQAGQYRHGKGQI